MSHSTKVNQAPKRFNDSSELSPFIQPPAVTFPSAIEPARTLPERYLLEHAPVPLWVHDRRSLLLLYANAAFCRLLGYSLPELRKLDLLALLPAQDSPLSTSPSVFSEERIQREKSFSLPQHLVDKVGRVRCARIHLTALPETPDQPAAVIGAVTELSYQPCSEGRADHHPAPLERALERISDGFFAVNRAWQITYVNPAAERILRRERHCLLGRVLWDEFPEIQGSTVEHACRRTLAENEAQQFEFFYPLLDVSLRVRTYPSGEGLTAYFCEVTPAQPTETALSKSEERFRLLAKATNDAVWDWDLTNQELWWNDGIEILFGFSREEIGTGIASWSKRIHPQDHDAVVVDIDAALARGDTFWASEYRFLRKDGTYAHVLDRGHIIRDPDGNPVRMIGGMTDRTEARRAAERIAEQAALLDQTRDAILVCDLDHQILYWNRGAERLYGWSAQQAVGTSCNQLLYRDPNSFLTATSATLARGEWIGELEQFTQGKDALKIEARWTLVRDAHGAPKAILAIHTDITERKKIELQFMRAQRLESIGTLAGGIAHDINNLLCPIILGVDLLRQHDLQPRVVNVLETIGHSAKRGSELVRHVLSFARGVEGARVMLQISSLFKEIEVIVTNTFPKNIRFERRVAADLWPVIGDPTQINQVLLNLCVNARDAMPEGGQLVLEARNVEIPPTKAAGNRAIPPGAYVAIQVSDSGTGMSAETLEHVFEPFFTTKDIGRGSGLGLSTALGIVRSHGGYFDVQSEIGAGSVLKFYLPAKVGQVELESKLPDQETAPRGRGECILVVDDEAPILNTTRHILEFFGYRVLAAEDGPKAIDIFSKHRAEIALVLTDMMMPVMDGPALIAALRKIEPTLRVIASSGLSTKANVAKARRVGARHFLAKPYSAARLLTLIRTALTEPAL